MDSRFRDAVDAFQRGDLGTALAIATKELDSSGPGWQHLLGLIECRRGNIAAGVDHLRAASEAVPDNDSFRLMLARALVDLGAEAEVIAMPEPDGPASPANLALWHVRAEAAQKLDDAAAAAKAWRAITAIAPPDHRAWINLGRSLLRLDLLSEAAEAYARALAIAPEDAAAIHELALLLERMNEIDRIAVLLESSAAAGIAKERLPFAWALLEQRRGNTEEAQRLLAMPGADRERIHWYRLAARVEDMLGNSAEAFAAAAAMNRSVPDFGPWRRRAGDYRERLRGLADAISTEWPAELPTLPPAEISPAFIVGFPRSGTTLLDTFLMGHREIEVLEELPLLADVSQALGPLEKLPSARRDALESAREQYLRKLAAALPVQPGTVVIDKFPLNMLWAPLIHSLFAASPIIFVQRHPCDAVLSGFMQSFVLNIANSNFLDLADAADFYDACMTVWTASCAKLTLNVRTVRYEDLVADPEATLRPVIEELALDWDERMLDHRATAKRRGPIANTSYNQVTEPLSAAPVLRWRRYEKELAPVLPVLLPWAERLGYPT